MSRNRGGEFTLKRWKIASDRAKPEVFMLNECYAANKCPFHLSMSTSKATKHPFVNETSIQVICQYLENFRPIHLLNVLQPLTIRYHDRLV